MRRALAELERLGCVPCLVGGLAVSVRSEPRFTRDLLFASSGIEAEIVAEGEALEALPGLSVRVARTGHLLALEVLARDDIRRPQDRVDLLSLLRVASPPERDRARHALELIEARGHHRERDLLGAWRQIVEEAG